MQLQKKYKLTVSIEDIQNILTDIHQYGKLHPLINGVEKTHSPIQGISNYKIREQPFSWLPINIKYFASVKSSENKVDYEITGLPFTKAWIHYDLLDLGHQKVEISFNLKIAGYLPGKKILQYKMVKAQDELMEAMQKKIM